VLQTELGHCVWIVVFCIIHCEMSEKSARLQTVGAATISTIVVGLQTVLHTVKLTLNAWLIPFFGF
jgi:hypothetical protein